MAKNNFAINSFVAGEVSDKFLGRFDTNQYAQACEEIRNWIVRPQGGAYLRPGTINVEKVRPAFKAFDGDPANPGEEDTFTQVRIVPFLASDGRRFQIVMKNFAPMYSAGVGVLYCSWYVLNIQTGEMSALTGTDVDAIGNEYAVMEDIDIREIQITQTGNRIYFTHDSFRPFFLQYVAEPLSFGPPPWPHIFGLTMLGKFFDASDPNKQYAVNAQLPFQAPNFPPSGGITQLQYKSIKATFPAGTWTAATTATLDTSFAGLGHVSLIAFDAGWIGRYLKFSQAGKTSVWLVTAVTNATTATVTYVGGDDSWGASNYKFAFDSGTNWEMSYWGGDLGWPSAVTGFEGRIFFGGSIAFPDTYWASQTNNVDRFMVRKFEQDPTYADPALATDPFDGTLRAETLSKIRWMSSGKNITAGTNSREFIIQGPNANLSIGPTNIQSYAETPHGSAAVAPGRIENAVVFLQRDRRSIRELVYSLDEASFQAQNLSIIAEHLSNRSAVEQKNDFISDESYIVDLSVQQAPNGILWACDNNGALLGLTRERIQQVIAWHYHELGGTTKLLDGTNKEFHPQVQSVSAIQRTITEDTRAEPDELWISTKRGVKVGANWEAQFFIERMAPEWRKAKIHEGWILPDADTPGQAPVYMDQSVILSNDDTEYTDGVISDLPHSPDSSVSVIVQGHYIGEFVVNASGEIDISAAVAELTLPVTFGIIVGYKYDNALTPVVPEVPAQLGTAFGNLHRIHEVTIHFVRTVAAKFGRKASKTEANTPIHGLQTLTFPHKENTATPRQMFTGDRKTEGFPGYQERPRMYITTDAPLPCEVTHIVAKQVVIEN